MVSFIYLFKDIQVNNSKQFKQVLHFLSFKVTVSNSNMVET